MSIVSSLGTLKRCIYQDKEIIKIFTSEGTIWQKQTPPSVNFVACQFSKSYPLTRSVSSSNAGYLLITGKITANGDPTFPLFGQSDCVYQDETIQYGGQTCYVYKSNMFSWQGSKSTGEILNWGTKIPSGASFVCDNDGKIIIFDSIPS